MKICRKEFLSEIVRMFKESGIIVIFDEVMTGLEELVKCLPQTS